MRVGVTSLLAWAALAAAFASYVLGDWLRAFRVACRVHSSAYSERAAHLVEAALRRALRRDDVDRFAKARAVLDRALAVDPSPRVRVFLDDPPRLFKSRAIVLKPSTDGEKGVLLLDYSFSFALFARLFDVEAVAKRYHLVLEPSWCGFCTPEILYYAQFEFPVFVLSGEPRDTRFLQGIGTNLVPVPIAGNWWVDHRVFRPLPDVRKDADVIMVAAWARYKAHDEVFAALGQLVRDGHRPRTLLVGYPGDLGRDEILRLADAAGIGDLIEVHESLTPPEVNAQLNRARVNLLWSRKEGFNRAIIEGMFAGVPCILRGGHNFGHTYPYINPMTGVFATPDTLAPRLVEMIRTAHLFAPREWVEPMMSCQRATELLSAAIRQWAIGHGERWTTGLVAKTVSLHNMEYWDRADEAQFADDYAFLERQLRPRSS